jgi:CelD/BcsL family acetyltransferase involved in cellulose biosynthesis
MHRTRTLHDHDAIAAAVTAWSRLDDAAASPMQHAAWSWSWLETAHRRERPSVVVVEDGAAVRAAAPLVQRRPGGPLELAGMLELGEPSDLAAVDAEALGALARALVELRRPVLLARVPGTSPTVRALRQAFRRQGLVDVRPAPPTPAVELDAGWTAPEGRLSSRRASDLRRARRRAERLGALEVELLAPAVAEVPGLLREAMAVEARSWKARAGTALVQDPVQGGFLRRFAPRAAAAGQLRISFLRLDGRAVATQVALAAHGRLWILKIGFDEAAASCSPGQLLMLEVLRGAAADGLEAVELLGTAEPWTAMWGPVRRPCVTVRAYPAALRGATRLAADAATVARRRAARARARG